MLRQDIYHPVLPGQMFDFAHLSFEKKNVTLQQKAVVFVQSWKTTRTAYRMKPLKIYADFTFELYKTFHRSNLCIRGHILTCVRIIFFVGILQITCVCV